MWVLLACSESFEAPVEAARPSRDVDDTGDAPAGPLQLCINEFMPDNESSARDDTDATPDWIELYNPSAVTVDLAGWALTDDLETPDEHVFAQGFGLVAGGFALLWADGLPELGTSHLGFRLGDEGGLVSLVAPDARASIVRYETVPADFSVARATDCCTGEACLSFAFRGTPGESNVVVELEDVPLVAASSAWRYLDTGVAPGPDWRAAGFDDAGWLEGPGTLGYGDAQSTVISYGPDAAAKPLTAWFRHTFTVTGVPAMEELEAGLVRDDGAAVYLNGVEIIRSNLPEGELTAATTASATTSDAAETSRWITALDPALLVEGTNILAAEVHQAAPDSSDLSFDLSLTGARVAR